MDEFMTERCETDRCETNQTFLSVGDRQTQNQSWLLESVVVNLRDAVVIAAAASIESPVLNIVYVNAAFTRLTDYCSEEVLGKSIDILHGKSTNCPQFNKIYEALEQQEAVQTELVISRKDRSEVWAELEVMPIAIQPDGFTHLALIYRDISNRKQAEAEHQQIEANMLQALNQEHELNEFKSRFVTMVSHEFRTPLSTILCSAELLESYGQQWSEDKRLIRLARIKEAVKRMSLLLNNVLTIGKAEAGKLQFKPAPLDIVQFCDRLIEELRPEAQNRHLLTYVPHCDLLPGCPCEADLDEQLLRHILVNLISNAMKYSPQGGKIQVELSYTSDQVIFHIQDQGIGIPPTDQERLFTMFQRGSNVGSIAGTGLGLSIVKQCVDLQGGCISVNSTVGVGTLFTVTLPLHPSAEIH
jgi:PAS domain S-box-containing protein